MLDAPGDQDRKRSVRAVSAALRVLGRVGAKIAAASLANQISDACALELARVLDQERTEAMRWRDREQNAATRAADELKRYRSLAGRHAVPRGAPVPNGLAARPRLATPGGNELVSEPDDPPCGLGCTQNSPSMAVSDAAIVVGFQDSRGTYDGTDSAAGYAYSTDGGATWVTGGRLPAAGNGDALIGSPSLVACDGGFYYASLSRTGCPSGGGVVDELEPNGSPGTANAAFLGDDFRGAIDAESDVDYVSFSASAGTVVEAVLLPGTLPFGSVLFDSDGKTALDFSIPGSSSPIVFTLPHSGTYYIAVSSPFTGTTGSYVLQLRDCTASGAPNIATLSVSKGVLDQGLVWSPPVVAAREPSGTLDRPSLACDPSTGALYVSYTDRSFSFSGRVDMVRSLDGGITWSEPSEVEPESQFLVNLGAATAVGPRGDVYVALVQGPFRQVSSSVIQLRRSTDRALSFPMKTLVSSFRTTSSTLPIGFVSSSFFPFSLFDTASIAVDGRANSGGGNVYVVFQDADRDVRDIKLARSTDRGASFEPPLRVNDDPLGADQFFPRVTVDPGDGQVSIVYYDRRRNPDTALTDVFLSQSNDGGRTFVPGVAVTDTPTSFLDVKSDALSNFGDYIDVASDAGSIHAVWTDGRRGTPDVFTATIAKDTAPSVLLLGSSVDDRPPNGDGDGAAEPGETVGLDLTLVNAGPAPATGVSGVLSTSTPGVSIHSSESTFDDLSAAGSTGSTAHPNTPYEIAIDPSVECARHCPPITTEVYGVDPGGTIVRFAFDTGSSASVLTPVDHPSGGPDGLAIKAPTDAFWVNGFGLDQIIEFNPQTGEQIVGPFPVPSPGTPNCTDGLAIVAPTRLFSQNFCEGKVYEIDTSTGQVVNASLPGGLGLVGGLAGGDGRLFATVGFSSIAEIDPDRGVILNAFPVPDLNGDRTPDAVLGLAFDGANLFASSASAAPPNVMAIDPATGALLGVSPFRAPSGILSALDAVTGPAGSVCIPESNALDFDLSVTTDQGASSSHFSVPLGRNASVTAFADDVEGGPAGWTASGEWHQTTDRAKSGTHAWYFGTEHGPGTADNAYNIDSTGDLTSPVFDLSRARSAELVFAHFLDTETNFDFATVSASNDGFVTSKLLGSFDPALDPTFTEVRLGLSAFAGSPAVQVRFTFTSDRTVVREGWYVDDIRIEETIPDCGPDDFVHNATTTTTTTTLPLPAGCTSDGDCEDGVRCTADSCVQGRCEHAPLGGTAGLECKIADVLEPALCGDEKIDPRLDQYIRSKLGKAGNVLRSSGSHIARSGRRAARLVKQVEAHVKAAALKQRISVTCLVTLELRLRGLRQALLEV